MSSALLEDPRVSRDRDPRQPPLFDDLRRAKRGSRPGRQDPDPEPGTPGPATARGERDPRSGGDRLSLEAQLERIWEDLIAAGAAECPVCGAAMERTEEQGACGGCGATLS